MTTISSPGLASGLDIKGIVEQLVALERAPLTQMQKQVSSAQSKLSVYGTLNSLVTSLGDAGSRLAGANAFKAVKASSSLPDAVGVTVAAGTAPTSFSLQVQRLAQAQNTASAAVPAGSGMGAGTLNIRMGDWSSGSFVAGADEPVEITVVEGQDTLADIAKQINASDAKVTATVLKDASGERLLLRSKATGAEMGFEVSATDSDPDDGKDLGRLAYLGAGSPSTLTQAGLNAQATLNGVAIESASNTVKDAIAGITLELKQVTAPDARAELAISDDKDAMRKTVQGFVDAYNALMDMLGTATKYDPETKVAGSLQGDSTAVGLKNAIRGMMRSSTPGGEFTQLLDIGIEIKSDGKMSLNSSKFDAALEKPAELGKLFGAQSDDPTLRGFGLKLDAFADGLVAADGTVSNRSESLRNSITRLNKDMDKVVDRAARAEKRYLAYYNAMDANVAKLNSLNAYIAQQVTMWNKNTS
jgi:flagellar hook-associated protein 2